MPQVIMPPEFPLDRLHEATTKTLREARLRWQSSLLLWLILPAVLIGLAALIAHHPNAATAQGILICAAFGLLVRLVRAATPFAALTGFLLTSCLYLATLQQLNGSWFHTALPAGLCLFILAFAATRYRRSQKESRGQAESRHGRRASQVAANMGAAALVALLLVFHWPLALPPIALLTALTAALAEAAADTVASEIGQAIGHHPRLMVNLRPAPPGTDGAITLPGTIAGCLAAAITAATAIPTLHLTHRNALAAAAAGILGMFLDSLLGATLERRNLLNNDLVNFISTSAAALIALAFLTWTAP